MASRRSTFVALLTLLAGAGPKCSRTASRSIGAPSGRHECTGGRPCPLQGLGRYFQENIYIDFSEGLSAANVRALLAEGDDELSRRVSAKIDAMGLDSLLVALADRLREHLAQGIDTTVMLREVLIWADENGSFGNR